MDCLGELKERRENKACWHIQEMKRLHSSRVRMSEWGFQQPTVLERLATSQKHTRIPNLGLVRFPTHKNSHMLPVNKT